MINDTHLVEIDDFTNYEETFQKPVMTGRVSLVPSEDLWKRREYIFVIHWRGRDVKIGEYPITKRQFPR